MAPLPFVFFDACDLVADALSGIANDYAVPESADAPQAGDVQRAERLAAAMLATLARAMPQARDALRASHWPDAFDAASRAFDAGENPCAFDA